MDLISKEGGEILKQFESIARSLYKPYSLEDHMNQIRSLPCKTCLPTVAIKQSVIDAYFKQSKTLCQGNKGLYRLHQIVTYKKSSAIDIATNKLRYAIVLLMKEDYDLTLTIINQVLSSIPPFALYFSNSDNQQRAEAERLYADIFLQSEHNIMHRTREAWLCDFHVGKPMTDIMPLAIQVELYFTDGDNGFLYLSPFICLYYFMFLCYHKLHQYDNRDRALRQLVEVVHNFAQCGCMLHHSYNITGHCLVVAGERALARDMFMRSYQFSRRIPPLDKFNSALWYMQHFC